MDRQPPKRPRLSMACNICRQRKVKCDAEYPKCRNCRVRNQECITTDPQRVGCMGFREWLEIPEPGLAKEQDVGGLKGAGGCHLQRAEQREGLENGKVFSPRQVHAPPLHESHPEPEFEAVPEDNSPIRQPFDTSVNTEAGTARTKVLGGSSSQCLAKSLDVYFRAARMKPVSGFFRHGMRQAEELDIPLAVQLPALPDAETRKRVLGVYGDRIHPLYPIVDLGRLDVGVEQLAGVEDLSGLARDEVPKLVGAYLVMSIGFDEDARCPTVDGERYLHAAASLVAHTIVVPYIRTVQSLLLFTIAYRGRNQEGLAWQMLGIAIRTAYTLGMHRRSKDIPTDEIHTRIWAICCSFEKVMHLASGWPTLIPDSLMASPDTFHETKHRFLHWHLGLATYQGSISQHLYSYRPAPSQDKSNRTVRQILLDTARLDRALLSWSSQIPPELRPGNDITCAPADFHILAFLSIEYHGTMIALHRAALIAPKARIEEEVMKYVPDDSSRFRLANGENICGNSARAIAKLSLELQDRGGDSVLIPTGTAGLACIALAIYLMKHPGSRMQAADMELLRACLEYAGGRFRACGFDEGFIEGLGVIYRQIQARLERNAADAPYVNDVKRQKLNHRPSLSSPVIGKPLATAQPLQLGQLPTPSTPPPNTPITAHALSYERANGVSTGISQGRTQSLSHSVPESRHTNHTDWTQPFRPDPIPDIPLDTSTNGFLNDVPSGIPGDLSTGIDEMFPFEGFNVEALWNWMLYLDSPGATGTDLTSL